MRRKSTLDALLAWYFVAVWGTGYVATKVGLQHAAPFTFLTLRFSVGLLCVLPVVFVLQTRWPGTRAELGHLVVAGLLMHAVQLGGSHYAQYLGMSAGISALIISTQPLLTAIIVSLFMNENLLARQWIGIALGLGGVALVVWHQIDVRAIGIGSLLGTLIAVSGVTAATLYQRRFSPHSDLKAAAVIQFAATVIVLSPLAVAIEGFKVDWAPEMLLAIAFLVVFASILAVSVLHVLMRHNEATRVTSLMYLPPIFAVAAEMVLFGVVPSALAFAGMAITCAGVALTAWKSSISLP